MMKYFALTALLIITFLGCSKKDETIITDNTVPATGYIRGYVNGVNWYSNSITTSKSGQTRVVTATQPLPNSQTFSSAILEFRISVNQTGDVAIGEDEPHVVYFARGYYTLVGKNGNSNELYKAYHEGISKLTITGYDSNHLYGTFNFIAHTDDTLKTVLFTEGSIQIEY